MSTFKSFKFSSQFTCLDLSEYHQLVHKLPELVKEIKSKTPFCGGLFVERAQPNFIVRSNKRDTIDGVLKIFNELRCAHQQTLQVIEDLTEGELESSSITLDEGEEGHIFTDRHAIARLIGSKGANINSMRREMIKDEAHAIAQCHESLDLETVQPFLKVSITFKNEGKHSICEVSAPRLMLSKVCDNIILEYYAIEKQLREEHKERERGVRTLGEVAGMLPTQETETPKATPSTSGFIEVKPKRRMTKSHQPAQQQSAQWKRVSTQNRFAILEDTEA